MTFVSTHHAIKVEEQLKQRNLRGDIVPTPREIDKSCGLSIKIPKDQLERAKELLGIQGKGMGLEIGLYERIDVEGKGVYIKKL